MHDPGWRCGMGREPKVGFFGGFPGPWVWVCGWVGVQGLFFLDGAGVFFRLGDRADGPV